MKQVKVIKECYSRYPVYLEVFCKQNIKNFDCGGRPLKNKIYNLLGKIPNCEYYNDDDDNDDYEVCYSNLYLIQDIDKKKVYIVEENNIEFIKGGRK